MTFGGILKNSNGTDYAHNYDLIVKWFANVLRGETLEVIGVKTGRIEEVFGFEPAEIRVMSGRLDVMVRDDTGALYHIEEQRNLKKSDMYRFAAYHFLGAGQWGGELTDIILASGEVWAGKKEKGKRAVTTRSGKYAPVIVDFTERDGRKRLTEIREAVRAGKFDNWLELVFIPLYGKYKGEARSLFVEEVLRFESELCRAEKIPARLLAAALILSNKLIDKERLKALWEDIRMLDILEIAREEGLKTGKDLGLKEGKDLGLKEGKDLGLKEGKKDAAREMIIEALIEKFELIPARVSEQIRAVRDLNILRGIFRHAMRCGSIEDFKAVMKKAA